MKNKEYEKLSREDMTYLEKYREENCQIQILSIPADLGFLSVLNAIDQLKPHLLQKPCELICGFSNIGAAIQVCLTKLKSTHDVEVFPVMDGLSLDPELPKEAWLLYIHDIPGDLKVVKKIIYSPGA